MKSIGFRFLIVGLLTVLMFVPLFLAGEVIDARANHSRNTVSSVGDEWGGPQLLSGPQIIIPVTGPVTRKEQRAATKIVNGKEIATTEEVEITEIKYKRSIYLYPDDYNFSIASQTQTRARGVFRVPVYVATADIKSRFDFSAVDAAVNSDETLLWNDAQLRVSLLSNKALRGAAKLTVGGKNVQLEPITGSSRDTTPGIMAEIGDPRKATQYDMELGFNGAGSFMVTPVGRTSQVTFDSDWPHPSFSGAFLPNTRTVSESGFEAKWLIPHLARNLPQISRENSDQTARAQTAFGVEYFQPNDFYQKAYRAARYGILFIALTFLTVLLIEDRNGRPTHPVQYVFIGLAQSLFVLLMVAYSEQIGFAAAYGVSAGATIILLTLFGYIGMKLGVRSAVLGVMLVLLYGVLYLILRSADYALLAGSTLAFLALAGTMYLTRNEDWYGEPGHGVIDWLNGKTPPPKPSAADVATDAAKDKPQA
ncbi:inner membrane protein [Litoreibacter halocynthiae]|uniref:Inner membrane protein n=1 Tax=Litoreibacter halocynthiae TaxID=1242689 RepID=A0A4R7LPY2_9RHOB|nr:cell envelope integrity protein CreD [Litoreibacter halocynthiae]TDT76802.1 inner membrane protein [Litoreibacter halocynthiae]